MSASNHKETARTAVKNAFNGLKTVVTKDNSASAILEKFTNSMQSLSNKDKKDGKSEKILGKYYATDGIKGGEKSPISKAVKEFLDTPGSVFTDQTFVDDLTKEPITAIGTKQKAVAKKLGKCKKLRSADVLAAIYYVASTNTENSVLRLLILGEMFTELGKANGFIKGNSAGESKEEDDGTNVGIAEKNDPKDDKNKHLGTLATKGIRSLAATIGAKIKKLFNDAEWLKNEQTNSGKHTAPTQAATNEEKVDDQSKTGRATPKYVPLRGQELAIHKLQTEKDMKTFAGEDSKTLDDDLKPRSKDEGKIKIRDMATTDQVNEFLSQAKYAFKLADLKNCFKDEDRFKKALAQTYALGGQKVTLRAILNKVADIVYENNNLENLVENLEGDPRDLKTLLDLVRAKLKRSHEKDKDRTRINKKLRNWVAIINVVEACEKKIEINYNAETTYENMLKAVVTDLKKIKITVVAENGEKLDEKEINNLGAINVDEDAALPELTDEYKKRLNSLKVDFDTTKDYKTKFNQISTFLKTPTETNIQQTDITLVIKNTNIPITKAHWDASVAFDKFVTEDGKILPNLIVESTNTAHLPPCNGVEADDRLRLTADDKGYADFTKPFTWFAKPTLDTVDTAIKALTKTAYLGKNKDLLAILKNEPEIQKVLGINTKKYVEVWVQELTDNMKKIGMDENVIVANEGDSEWKDLGNEIIISVRTDNKGISKDVYKKFETYVKSNASADFLTLLVNNENKVVKLLTGNAIILVQDPSASANNNNNQKNETPTEGDENNHNGGEENENNNNEPPNNNNTTSETE